MNNLYNLSKLNTNYNNIKFSNDDKVFVCVYQIVESTTTNIVYKPYLRYLLYKYPSPKNEFIFPFDKVKNRKPLNVANKLAKDIIKDPITLKGCLTHNNNHYFFYKYNISSVKIPLIYQNQQLWWIIIDEICNQRKVITYPVSKLTYSIFYKFPFLIYLTDVDKENIEIPSICYFGSPAEIIPYIAAVGIRSNASQTYGSFFLCDNFLGSIKHALFTSNYRQRNIFSKNISDKNGKNFNGAVVRNAIFLGKKRQILYRKTDPFYYFIQEYDKFKTELTDENLKNKTKQLKGKWALKYDSLMISRVKFKNLSGYYQYHNRFVIKSQKQINTLSYHLIDMKNTENVYNPYFQNYKIL